MVAAVAPRASLFSLVVRDTTRSTEVELQLWTRKGPTIAGHSSGNACVGVRIQLNAVLLSNLIGVFICLVDTTTQLPLSLKRSRHSRTPPAPALAPAAAWLCAPPVPASALP